MEKFTLLAESALPALAVWWALIRGCALIGFLALTGLVRGFWPTALSLVVLAVAYFCAYDFVRDFIALLPLLPQVLAHILVDLAFPIAALLVADALWWRRLCTQSRNLGVLDRLVGACLGVAAGTLFWAFA